MFFNVVAAESPFDRVGGRENLLILFEGRAAYAVLVRVTFIDNGFVSAR